MNDHQDSEHFSYERTWEEIQNQHYVLMQNSKRSERIHHMRNYKALEGVVKALRWTLGDIKINHPLE